MSPLLVSRLIRTFGWRHALGTVGLLILIVLVPVGILLTRSTPAEMGLLPDGDSKNDLADDTVTAGAATSSGAAAAARTTNFWLILAGSTLVVGAIGAVIQHFILFLRDQGYSSTAASRFSTVLLASSLGGRVLVGYLADRFSKKDIMALFYLLIGLTIPILYISRLPSATWFFALAFGFAMGADYMLIPLVTAECFGTAALGKILALIIMGYSLGQWAAPWMAGRLFDSYHSYDLAWKILAGASLLGAAAIYRVSAGVGKG
jgi:sugar phosphate permease